jgi:pyridinium-3,5-biscarboxylic acid mononucleotide sulfurtransferase
MNEKLFELLKQYKRVAIAFSGGTDSTLLASAALRTLGLDNVLLIFADSAFTPQAERAFALKWAREHEFQLVVAEFAPLELEAVAINDPERCYHCKKAIFSKAQQIAREQGFEILCDGTNTDDYGDYRPGLKACNELGVKHPLADSGMDKQAVRELSKEYGNQNWNRPASACLASRVPCGRRLEADLLKQVDAVEDILREQGFTGGRARVSGNGVRLELPPEQIERAASLHNELSEAILAIGFSNVSLDLQGYRRGSTNKPE